MKKVLLSVVVLLIFSLSACADGGEVPVGGVVASCIKNYNVDQYSYKEHAAPALDFADPEKKCDATMIEGSCKIGTLKEKTLLSKEDYAKIIEDLLLSKSVGTYWHLSSAVCLEKETDDAANYRMDFSATHEYCTNDCYSEDYTFSISIDKESGEVVLLEK